MPRSATPRSLWAILLGLWAVTCPGCRPAAPTKTPAIDPQVRELLEAFGKYIAGLPRFEVTVNSQIEIIQNGRKSSSESTQHVKAERPNRLALSMFTGGVEVELIADGETASYWAKDLGRYFSQPAPQTWGEILAAQLEAFQSIPGNASVITDVLLAEDPAAKILATVEKAQYAGEVMLDGVNCHLIKANGENMDWQMWIDVGDKPLLRKFEPNLAKLIARMARETPGNRGLANLQASSTITCEDWQIDPSFATDVFSFTPPEDSVRVASIRALIYDEDAGSQSVNPLLGKPAPQIKLALLDGGELDLEALRGKVVILDFWATWCVPCIRALPIIEKVAHDFKNQGVVLYGVNQEEEPARVQKFLDDRGFYVPIALDKEGLMSSTYGARSIPYTVLIGKDGTVQVVHVGFGPDLAAELSADIEALLADKDLASEAKSRQP